MTQEPADFEEFWPIYLAAHSDPRTRMFHYCGTVLACFLLLYFIYFLTLPGRHVWWALVGVPLLGYGPAWIAHLLIERNKPATFRHPLWSFAGDFRMLYLAVTGRLEDELWRYKLR
ncbi:MAG TPA: DUF962 domain-containing protein [Stellaceae bacterium]|nr:DUF962 domain-containing protein [Stellaceae bacterium]